MNMNMNMNMDMSQVDACLPDLCKCTCHMCMHMCMSHVTCLAPGEAAQNVEHARHVLGLECYELLVVEEHAGDDLHARADDAAPCGGRSVVRAAKGTEEG